MLELQADVWLKAPAIPPRAVCTGCDMLMRMKQTPANFSWHVCGNGQDRSPCPTSTTTDTNCPQSKPPGWYCPRHRRKNLISIMPLTLKHSCRETKHAARQRPGGVRRIIEDKSS